MVSDRRTAVLPPFPSQGQAPSGGPVFSVPGLRLRHCRMADVPFLRRLYRHTRKDELAPTGWPEAMKRAFCDQQFDAQHTDYVRRFAAGSFLLILDRIDPVGRLYLDLSTPALHLVDIALLPDQRGKGTGSAVLRRLQEMAAAIPEGSVHLAVDPMNPRARALYERHGFAVTDTGPSRLFMRWSPPT